MARAPGNEEALAVAFAAHERWAFARAYQEYASLLYSVAYNVLRNGEEAQDCVADAIARLWRSSSAYSSKRGSVRSFLVVCVRNEAISRRRRQNRRVRLEEPFAKVPDDQRAALQLAFYDGKTHTEIAAELNVPLGTIKSRISLGLRKIAATLGSDESDR
jgi:RNA polymerase sigma-70 factor (ECF subfamily)